MRKRLLSTLVALAVVAGVSLTARPVEASNIVDSGGRPACTADQKRAIQRGTARYMNCVWGGRVF